MACVVEGERVAGLSDVAAPLGEVANGDEEVGSFAGRDERVELKGLDELVVGAERAAGATVEAMSMVEGTKGLASTFRADPTTVGSNGDALVDRVAGAGMFGVLFEGLGED